MTVEKAIDVLNEMMHNGASDWRHQDYFGTKVVASPSVHHDRLWFSMLTEFEAIAVAERYARAPEPTTAEIRPTGAAT